jgi:hypothetical protein
MWRRCCLSNIRVVCDRMRLEVWKLGGIHPLAHEYKMSGREKLGRAARSELYFIVLGQSGRLPSYLRSGIRRRAEQPLVSY